MKSISGFGLAFGMIVLLSNQVLAGETTEWVNEDKAPSGLTGLTTGGGMFVASGLGKAKSADMRAKALNRLRVLDERQRFQNQVNDAEREYQTEKAKFEKLMSDSREQSKGSNVVTLEAVRQRRTYEQAEAKYKNLQTMVNSIEKRFSRDIASPANVRITAEKDLRSAETLSRFSFIGMITSIPVIFVPGVTSVIASKRMEKAEANAVSPNSRDLEAAPSQPNMSAR